MIETDGKNRNYLYEKYIKNNIKSNADIYYTEKARKTDFTLF